MKNEYEINGDKVTVYCNFKQGKVPVHISVDDLEVVSSIKGAWVLKTDRTSRGTQYAMTHVGKKSVLMHRLIMGVTCPNDIIDHIDGNGLNNQKQNLRITTRSGNGRNRFGTRSDNKSGYNGVAFQSQTNKWKATIHYKGKQKYLGIFENVEDAIKARKEAEILYGYKKED